MSTNPRHSVPRTHYRDMLVLGDGPKGIGCRDATGTHFYGQMDRFTRAALHNLDVYLESRDAANELSDGSLA